MKEKAEKFLESYLPFFKEQHSEVDSPKKGISKGASGIARAYVYINSYTEAKQYFGLAAISQRHYVDEKYDYAKSQPKYKAEEFLACGRNFWWLGEDDTAKPYFDKGLEFAQEGTREDYKHSTAGNRFRCWLYGIYALLFLGRYKEAEQYLLEARREEYNIPGRVDPGVWVNLLDGLINVLQSKDLEVFKEVFNDLEKFVGDSVFGMSVPVYVDMYELAKRTLFELQGDEDNWWSKLNE